MSHYQDVLVISVIFPYKTTIAELLHTHIQLFQTQLVTLAERIIYMISHVCSYISSSYVPHKQSVKTSSV